MSALRFESTLLFLVFGFAAVVCDVEKPCNYFDLSGGVPALRDTINSFSAYQEAIIGILGNISFSHRHEIGAEYLALTGRYLIDDIENKLPREVVELIVAMTSTYFDRIAKELHDALSTPGTADDVIIDVVNNVRNCENYDHVIEFYRKPGFDKSLISDLERHPSESFRDFLLPLFKGDCNQAGEVNHAWVLGDVRDLLKTSSFVPLFSEIFRHRSRSHLREVLLECDRQSEDGIEAVIKNETSGSLQRLLLAIVENTKDRESYNARRLHESIGTKSVDYRTITRVFVGEFYKFAEILAKYEKRYEKPFHSSISEDSSNLYTHALKTFFYNKRTSNQKREEKTRKMTRHQRRE